MPRVVRDDSSRGLGTMNLGALRLTAAEAQKRGDYARASESWRMIVREAPDSSEAQESLGRLLREMADAAGSINAFRKAVLLPSGRSTANHDFGHICLNTQRLGTALEIFDRGLRMTPRYDGLRFLCGVAATRLNWLDVAYRYLAGLPPDTLSTWVGERERSREALRQLRARIMDRLAARRRGPLSRGDLLELAADLVAAGKIRAASSIVAELRGVDGVPQDLLPTLLALTKRRDGRLAAMAVASAASRQGQPAAVAHLLATACLDGDDYASAARILQELPEEQHSEATRSTLSVALLLTGDLEELGRVTSEWCSTSGTTLASRALLSAQLARGLIPRALRDQAPWQSDMPLPIIQFWHDPQVPDDVAAAMTTWIGSTPGLQPTVFSAASARAWLHQHVGPQAVRYMDRCYHPAMEADLFRLYYLLVQGGVYVDADESCRAPLTPLLNALTETEAVVVISGELVPYVHNYFIVCRPGSKLLQQAIRDVEARLEAEARPPIWDATGPGCVTRSVARVLLQADTESGSLVNIISEQQYRNFALNHSDLAYKRTVSGSWTRA
ncbi:glycosyltransferase [Roseomonas elaeocarpi]|uniref:Glycosyltransferase n=1 Tax=Roseomonas elaeocarpi TaxID=907779 RepID=A0ABV6JYN2_9PROT